MTQGIATGFATFLDGYLKGQEMKERRSDRKRQDERQKKLDEYRAQQEERAIEAHDWRRSDQQMRQQQIQLQVGEQERKQASEAALEQARIQAFDAANADFRTGSAPAVPQVEPVAVTGPTLGATPQSPDHGPDLPSVFAPQGDAAVNSFVQTPDTAPQQAKSVPALGAAQPQVPGAATPPQEAPKQSAGLRITGDGLVLPPVRDPDYVTPQPQDYEYFRPGQAGRDIDRAGHAVGNTVGNVVSRTGEAVANAGIGAVQNLNAPLQAASRWIFGKDHLNAPEKIDLNDDGKSQTVLSPVSDFLFEKQPVKPAESGRTGNTLPDSASPAEAAVANTASAALKHAAEESPALASADKASKSPVTGATKDKPMTGPQRKAAAKTWTDSYLKVGVPVYEQALLRQGRYDDAKALREWADSASAKKGMQAWGQAAFAAQAGDIERAVDLTFDIINTHGYADYGYDVLKDQSEIIRDEAGSPTDIRLMLRNQQTGETFPMEDNIAGFIANALYLTNPEAAFEQENERQKTMSEAMVKAEAERRKAATDLITGDYDNANKAALELFKADQQNAALEGREALTWQEALAAVNRPAPGPVRAADNVPVMRPK